MFAKDPLGSSTNLLSNILTSTAHADCLPVSTTLFLTVEEEKVQIKHFFSYFSDGKGNATRECPDVERSDRGRCSNRIQIAICC